MRRHLEKEPKCNRKRLYILKIILGSNRLCKWEVKEIFKVRNTEWKSILKAWEPVASTYTWHSRKLYLAHVISSSSAFLTSAVIPTLMLFLSCSALHPCGTPIYFQHSSGLGTCTEFWQGVNFFLWKTLLCYLVILHLFTLAPTPYHYLNSIA